VGTSLHSCVEVHEPIELSFGVVSGGGPGICVLDGVDVLKGEERGGWEVSQSFSPIHFSGTLLSRNVLDSCVKS